VVNFTVVVRVVGGVVLSVVIFVVVVVVVVFGVEGRVTGTGVVGFTGFGVVVVGDVVEGSSGQDPHLH